MGIDLELFASQYEAFNGSFPKGSGSHPILDLQDRPINHVELLRWVGQEEYENFLAQRTPSPLGIFVRNAQGDKCWEIRDRGRRFLISASKGEAYPLKDNERCELRGADPCELDLLCSICGDYLESSDHVLIGNEPALVLDERLLQEHKDGPESFVLKMNYIYLRGKQVPYPSGLMKAVLRND